MIPIDFLFKSLQGERWLNEMDLSKHSDDAICKHCNRRGHEWPIKNQGVTGSFSGQIETHCTSCHVLFESSLEMLGLESIRGASTSDFDEYADQTGKGMDLLSRPSLCSACKKDIKSGLPENPDCQKCQTTIEKWNKSFVEPVCDHCHKPGAEWQPAYRGIRYKLDGQKVTICISCQSTHYESRVALLNDPRIKNSGSLVGAKFGMLTGCGLITGDAGTTIGANHSVKKNGEFSGFYSKLIGGVGSGYDIIQATNNQWLAWLFYHCPEPPFIFISELKRTKDNLVNNLRITRSATEVFICSDDGIETINLEAWRRLIDLIQTFDEKELANFRQTVKKYISGEWSLVSDELEEYLAEASDRVRGFQLLPQNPIEADLLMQSIPAILAVPQEHKCNAKWTKEAS